MKTIKDVKDSELKFWIHAPTNILAVHDIDTHHVKMVCKHPETFGLMKEDIRHNPYAEDSDAFIVSEDELEEMEEVEEDTALAWTEANCDNDFKISLLAMQKGWVRGGLGYDFVTDQVQPDIYIQSNTKSDMRRVMESVLEAYPFVDTIFASIYETDQDLTFSPFEALEFAQTGKLPEVDPVIPISKRI